MRAEALKGHLDGLILATLASGPAHGYAIAQLLRDRSDGAFDLPEGTLYPALLKLEQEGYIRSRWGVSENNRKAKFYELTKAGQRQVKKAAAEWEETTAILARFLAPAEEG